MDRIRKTWESEAVQFTLLFILIQVARMVPLVTAYLVAAIFGGWQSPNWSTLVWWVFGVSLILSSIGFFKFTNWLMND